MSKENIQSTDSYVTTRAAAKLLNVSLRTIQLWVESGILSAWKTAGGHRKVSIKSIDTVLLQRKLELKSSDIETNQPASEFNILLVEDDEGIRQLFRFFFTNWKYNVSLDIAENGFEGLISLGNKAPDLLITDLNMPGINGFELLRHLKTSQQFKSLDIVIITAISSEDLTNNVVLTPNIKVFHKPLNLDSLEAYILPLIRKKVGK